MFHLGKEKKKRQPKTSSLYSCFLMNSVQGKHSLIYMCVWKGGEGTKPTGRI